MNQMKVEQVSEDKKKFHYMLLSRLQCDCNYFLGNGNRHVNHLWADTVEEHIAKMKELWLSFAENDKPEWLSWQDILHYEKEMLN